MNTATLDFQSSFAGCAFEDVRRIAKRQRRRFLPDEAPATTVLAQDAYHRIAGSGISQPELLRATAAAMREVITDLARAKFRFKRDSDEPDARDVDKLEVAGALWNDGGEDRIVVLEEALQRLRTLNPRLASLVDCRFFAGYSDGETAEALGVDDRTVRRDWAKARAWLYREIGPDV